MSPVNEPVARIMQCLWNALRVHPLVNELWMILNYFLSLSLFYLECVNYRRITNADRKVTYGKVSVQCDKTIDAAWYRFEGAAGTRMPTSCPPLYKCNTNAPGWLKGGHPSVADDQVTRKACFHWSSCCSLSTNIKVRNCGPYYVYYLKSTGSCWYRYCSTD